MSTLVLSAGFYVDLERDECGFIGHCRAIHRGIWQVSSREQHPTPACKHGRHIFNGVNGQLQRNIFFKLVFLLRTIYEWRTYSMAHGFFTRSFFFALRRIISVVVIKLKVFQNFFINIERRGQNHFRQ